MIGSNMKRVIALIAASAAAVSLAACGSNSSQDSKTIEFWDPYPQKNDSSTWAKYVTNCAPEGYNVKRIGYAQSDLLNNLTTAVKAGNAPQIALIDNPKMPTAVDAGLVTDIEAAGVDVSRISKVPASSTTYNMGFLTALTHWACITTPMSSIRPASTQNRLPIGIHSTVPSKK